MARGKHKRVAESRRTAALESAIDECKAELASELQLLEIARVEAAKIAARRVLLDQLYAEQARAAEPEVKYLEGQIAEVRRALTAEARHEASLEQHWGPFLERLLEMFGGRVDGWEMIIELFSGERGTITFEDRRKGMSQSAVRALQYARGDRLRPKTPSLMDRTRHPLDGLLPAYLADRLATALAESSANAPTDDIASELGRGDATDDDLVEETGATRDVDVTLVDLPGVTDADWNAATGDALAAWHPMPWLVDALWVESSPAADALGVPRSLEDPGDRRRDLPHDSNTQPIPLREADVSRPVPAMTESRRSRLAQHRPDEVIGAWSTYLKHVDGPRAQRLAHPLAEWPIRTSATIATSVSHWYTLAGMGNWQRAYAAQDARTSVFGEIAVGCAAAAPFWLPPAQTSDFLNSEPLTDFDDLRLPFPQVLLTFAEPLELPLIGAAENGVQSSLGVLDAAMLTERRQLLERGPYRVLSAASAHLFGRGFTTSVADAIADRAGRIEGMLLLGDSLGRLSDTMAWALSIPATNGGVLARLLVPARWQSSIWRDQILNAAAVTAWADWHAPDEPVETGERDVSAGPGASPGTSDGVYVLAVRSTSARGSRSEPTGRQLPTHIRRGHWRRQHHGPRGELVKRVRIAPTVVNASRRDLSSRVYRLPGPSA